MNEEEPAGDLDSLLGQYRTWPERRYWGLTKKLFELAGKGSASLDFIPFLQRQLILKGSIAPYGNDTEDELAGARDQAACALGVLAETGVCDRSSVPLLVRHLMDEAGHGSGGRALKAIIASGAASALDIVTPFNKTLAAPIPETLGAQYSRRMDAVTALVLLARNGIGHSSSLELLYPCAGETLKSVAEAAEATVALLNGLGIGSTDEANRRMASYRPPGIYDEFK